MSLPTTERGAIQQAIRALKADGWELDFVDDGGENIKVQTEAQAIEAIMAVDVAHLWVKRGDKVVDTGWMFIVLGNSPEEVICDYTVNLDALDKLMDTWI